MLLQNLPDFFYFIAQEIGQERFFVLPKVTQFNLRKASISTLSFPGKSFSDYTERAWVFKSENTVLLPSFIVLNLLSIDREIDLPSAYDESVGILEFDLNKSSKI